jgi:hypothetical protein
MDPRIAAVEIERQLDYIPGDDRDAGSSPDVAVEGPAVAPTMTGSAFEECRFRAATCLSQGLR